MVNQTCFWPHKTLVRTHAHTHCGRHAQRVCASRWSGMNCCISSTHTHTTGCIAPSICAGFHGDRELKITWATALLYHSPTHLTQNVTRSLIYAHGDPPTLDDEKRLTFLMDNNRDRWRTPDSHLLHSHSLCLPHGLCSGGTPPCCSGILTHTHVCMISSLSPTLTHFRAQAPAWHTMLLPKSYAHITFFMLQQLGTFGPWAV